MIVAPMPAYCAEHEAWNGQYLSCPNRILENECFVVLILCSTAACVSCILPGNRFVVPNHLLGAKKYLRGGALSRLGCGLIVLPSVYVRHPSTGGLANVSPDPRRLRFDNLAWAMACYKQRGL